MNALVRFSVVAAATSLLPAELSAQTAGRMAVGANVSLKRALDPDSRGHNSIGLLWRLGHGREGWGWKYGINWYSVELETRVSGEPHAFGKLRVRPILAGYGYTHLIGGRTKLSANLMGGYSFNSFDVRDTYTGAYRAARDVDSLETSTSNGFVLKPEVSLWYDIGRKFGVNVSSSYLISRPEVTVTSSFGRERLRVSGDMLSIKAGLVYSVF